MTQEEIVYGATLLVPVSLPSLVSTEIASLIESTWNAAVSRRVNISIDEVQALAQFTKRVSNITPIRSIDHIRFVCD